MHHGLEIKKWSDDPQEIETAILSKHLLKSKQTPFKKGSNQGASKQSDRIWFCSQYQRNKCPHKSTHLQVVKSKQRMATHILLHVDKKIRENLNIQNVHQYVHIFQLDTKMGFTRKAFTILII